ncbi:MAG: hypothetical protein CSA96_01815 [Bacteroidetes bacterium]|nr:MAG: hypothetical protein CSA96_01815 [Bacteroidota bacterium]
MKTIHALLFAGLLFLLSCGGGKGDLQKYGLKGKVKMVLQHQYNATAKDGEWVAGTPTINGHRVTFYGEDGSYRRTVTMNHAGDTLGYTTTAWEDGEMVEETYISVYDRRETKTLLERVSSDRVNFEVWEGEKLQFEGANFFDSRGRLERQVRVVNDRELAIHWVYEKDILVENYEEDMGSGKRTATQHYEYRDFDDKGNWTTQLVFPGKDKISAELVVKREITYY